MTFSSSRAARRSATATPATSPARASRRRSVGTVRRSTSSTTARARRALRRSPPRVRRSSPVSATSRSSSEPTRRPRASSRPPAAAIVRRTRTGCVSACSARRTRSTSVSMRGAAWNSTARPRRTSRQRQGEEQPLRRGEPVRALQEGVHDGGRPELTDGVRSAAPPPDLCDQRRRRSARADE